MNSENPVKSERSLTSDFVFTSRTAVYAIRMYGAVGGALSNGRPYPYMYILVVLRKRYYRIRPVISFLNKLNQSILFHL